MNPLMTKQFTGFVICFLIFVYSVIERKWNGLYVALPGMIISTIAMAYTFFGGV